MPSAQPLIEEQQRRLAALARDHGVARVGDVRAPLEEPLTFSSASVADAETVMRALPALRDIGVDQQRGTRPAAGCSDVTTGEGSN